MNDKTKENSKKEGEGNAGKIKTHPDAVPDLSKANEKPPEPHFDRAPEAVHVESIKNKPPKVGDSGSAGMPAGSQPLIDQIYDKIDSLIGGSNPNQFLCLTLPGQALAAEDFSYDYKNNEPKGPVVEANESRLANKLFDPCRITGADNGLTLPYQYRSALDILTPMLNAKVADAKNKLRQLLMTKYDYDFDEKVKKEYTLQEVFFKLYDEWVAAKESWLNEQAEKKKELRESYPETGAQDNEKFNDAYLEWYEQYSESRISELNEKLAKVIAVFTPNDMEILEGVLDTGSGAELQQARQTLLNTQKLAPDGGYVYPVKLNPTNWFELLSTSFTPYDLLKNPEALSMELQSLSAQRMKISERIDNLSALVPDQTRIAEIKTAIDTAKEALVKSRNDLIESYGAGIKAVWDTLLDLAPLFEGASVPADIIKKLVSGPAFKGMNIEEIAQKLIDAGKASSQTHEDYMNAAQKLSDAVAREVEVQNLSSLNSLLPPLRAKKQRLDEKISSLKSQISLAYAKKNNNIDSDGKDKNTSESDVKPYAVPEGYTQVIIAASASALDQASSNRTSAGTATGGADFWFAGGHGALGQSSSNFSQHMSSSDTSVQIGMNIAKVGIEREWFNPGVFYLTKDMFNLTTHRISPNPAIPYTSVNDARLNDMADQKIFPCYPVAFVVARDISVKIIAEESISSEFADSMEQHASCGGGCLIFSGAASSSSQSASTGAHTSSTNNTLTIRFSTPQVIGYYLEATAADQSTYLDDVSKTEQAGYVSISEFVEKYRQILEEYNAKADRKPNTGIGRLFPQA